MNKSVKNQLVSGVLYISLTKYSGIIVSLIISAILSRILIPKDFGIVAIATVLVQFLSIFSDLGVGPAIIQSKNLDKEDLSSIFTFTFWIGMFLCLLLLLLSSAIGSFYDSSELVIICKYLSINLIFASLNIVPNALLLKNKNFKFIAQRTLSLQIIFGLISILFAFYGLGIYSLVVSPILTSIGVFVLSYRQYPQQILLSPKINALHKILSFSSYQFLFNFFNYFSRNLDKLIIGRYINMDQLGYYEKSYRLMMLPLQNITNVLTPVIQPIFSQFENNLKVLSSNYLKIVRLLASIGFPLTVFLYFSGSDLIELVYGDNWENAIPTFKILSLSVAGQMLLSTTGSIFQSANATKIMFFNGVSNTVTTITGFIVSSYYFKTIEAVAWSWNITLYVNFIISFYLLYKIVLKEPVKHFLSEISIPIFIFLLAFIGLQLLEALRISDFVIIRLVTKSVVVILISLTTLQLTKQYDIIGTIKKLNKNYKI